MGQPDLFTLFHRARAGSRTALNEFLGRLRPRVLRYLRGRTASSPAGRALAAELTQDVLVTVARKLDACRASTDAELWGWVRRIAWSRAADWYRSREEEIERRRWGPGPGDDPEVRPVARRTSTDEASREERALGRILMAAQEELSPGTQRVVTRRLLLRETWRRVGEAIDTTRGGAKRRWQRARPRLREEVLDRVSALPDEVRRAVLRRLGLRNGDA